MAERCICVSFPFPLAYIFTIIFFFLHSESFSFIIFRLRMFFTFYAIVTHCCWWLLSHFVCHQRRDAGRYNRKQANDRECAPSIRIADKMNTFDSILLLTTASSNLWYVLFDKLTWMSVAAVAAVAAARSICQIAGGASLLYCVFLSNFSRTSFELAATVKRWSTISFFYIFFSIRIIGWSAWHEQYDFGWFDKADRENILFI